MHEDERAERHLADALGAVRITTGLLADTVRAELDTAPVAKPKRAPRKTWARGLHDADRARTDKPPKPAAKAPREVQPRREPTPSQWQVTRVPYRTTFDPDDVYWHSPNNPAHG